jgi:hypothetical protein
MTSEVTICHSSSLTSPAGAYWQPKPANHCAHHASRRAQAGRPIPPTERGSLQCLTLPPARGPAARRGRRL